MKLVVITGANGFVGKNLLDKLSSGNVQTRLLLRRTDATVAREDLFALPYGAPDELTEKLKGASTIVHLGARAHVLNESVIDVLAEYRKANTVTSLQLANSAANAGVKRFVFVSSIGVNGNRSLIPFNETSPPSPVEPYAVSKLEAEEGLRTIAMRTGMEVVIVRPPLVYGPNCPGNFLRLLYLVYKGLPLPIGSVNNLRSLIGVSNLADFLVRCIDHPEAASKTFLIADKPDLSTPDMMRILAQGMGRPSRLLPAPYGLIRGIAGLCGKRATLDKLCGTLQVDSSFARKTLDWTEPMSLREGLSETGRWYAQMKADEQASLGKK